MAGLKPVVLLEAFYKRGTAGVPSPADPQDGNGVDWWWDHLAKQAHELAQVGFTAIWLPPVLKGGSGTLSVGYDVFDDYDLGSKDQQGTVPTRYGTREQLQRCVAILRTNGLDVYLDLVENQRTGGSGPGGFTFRYVDAYGRPGKGRFPKDPLNFHPNVPQDPNVFQNPEIVFGCDLAPINGQPAGYVFDGLLAAADWLSTALDVQGYRLDDAKGVSTDFAYALLQHHSLAGKFAVGEFYDGNSALVSNWVSNQHGMRSRASAFDFPLFFMLAQMCNGTSNFDMSLLDHAGLAGFDPFHSVTFVENHDLESGLNHITRNKPLAYAYILTSEGYPCVFYKDYSTDPGCLGLKPVIDNLIWIHQNLAEGPTEQRWKDHDVFAYERLWGAHLLVGLNNDEQNTRTITVATGFGGNTQLHDYTGHGPDIWTDGNGQVTMTLPRNIGGFGYVCYSRAGQSGGFALTGQRVTQVFQGAEDLDIKPADDHHFIHAGRIWVVRGEHITSALRFDTTSWTTSTQIVLALDGPDGHQIVSKTYTSATAQNALMSATVQAEGWYTFRIRSMATPPDNPKPKYSLRVTYRAPHVLTS